MYSTAAASLSMHRLEGESPYTKWVKFARMYAILTYGKKLNPTDNINKSLRSLPLLILDWF